MPKSKTSGVAVTCTTDSIFVDDFHYMSIKSWIMWVVYTMVGFFWYQNNACMLVDTITHMKLIHNWRTCTVVLNTCTQKVINVVKYSYVF